MSTLLSRPNSLPLHETALIPDLRAGPALDPATMCSVRRQLMLDGCKWDPQVGDVDTLAPFPIILKRQVWTRLAAEAEQLTREAMTAEAEIVRRPELLARLGLPRALLRALLAESAPLTPGAGRVIRYDFHPTTKGWQISEANSDVPGGYSESSYFTGLMATRFPQWQPAGNPAKSWSDALAASAGHGGTVALLSAPGYLEDHQVISFLARQLNVRGCRAFLCGPAQIHWRDGLAHLETGYHRGPVDVLVRFYQAEWLSRLPRSTGWENFIRGGKTLVANPPLAIISESKRFPLVWDQVSTPLPTWRALLPETREVRRAPDNNDWLLKTAYCNTGDTVSIRELMPRRAWLGTRLSAWLRPNHWLAQRRFESVPIPTPAGPRHVCLGIYTVNGRAAGAYVRLAEKPVIDFAAVDAALLIEEDE